MQVLNEMISVDPGVGTLMTRGHMNGPGQYSHMADFC